MEEIKEVTKLISHYRKPAIQDVVEIAHLLDIKSPSDLWEALDKIIKMWHEKKGRM